MQGWITEGAVTVNGRPVRRVAARCAPGAVVAIVLPETAAPTPSAIEPDPATLDVLFEDAHLLAVNKPAGIVVHPTHAHASGTLMNALVWYARDWPAMCRPSIVGRLDKLTSGIVVVAKTAAIHAALQRSLATTTAEKEYLAVVYGRVDVPAGRIALRLSRDSGDRRRMVTSDDRGAASLTRFERLGRVAARRAGLALLKCRLMTGRTHQIRAHLASRGWPIVGDPTYGEPRWSSVLDVSLAAALRAFPRQALHAWRLALVHPITRSRLEIRAPIPEDLQTLLAASGLDGVVEAPSS